jgi:KaiC/GvpD/RAD55 family RecA-like ATPase
MPLKSMSDSLYSIQTRPQEERAYFGITYLDAALKGIAKNDLVLIAGLTGTGKTEMGTMIAQTNLRAGKRVLYVALEAEEDEITDRMRFNALVKRYKESGGKDCLLYDEYRDGNYNILLRDEMKQVDRIMEAEYGSFSAFYRDEQDRKFGTAEMKKLVEENYQNTELFIFDHLHYFDLWGENENIAMRALLHEMRDVVLIFGRPIVLIAHIRKRTEDRIVPIIEDLHGSSDIVKTGTKLIFLAPYYGKEIPAGNKYPTIFYCAKYRRLGIVARYAGIQLFDPLSNSYDPSVWLGTVSNMCTKFTPIKKDLFKDPTPVWAQRRIRHDLIRYDFNDGKAAGTRGGQAASF